MWDVVVVGGMNSDYLIRGETLPTRGQTVEGETFLQGPGGKGANQAVAAARLGARAAIIGRVGAGEHGNAMIDALRREGVDTQYVSRDEHAETGAAVIMVDKSGEKQILTAPGANLKLTEYDVLKAESVIRSARVVLAQFEVPAVSIAEAFRIARVNGVGTILDPAPPRPFDRSILRNVEIIRPNSTEAEALTGIKVTGRESAKSAADALLAQGVQAAVVQAGSEGNLLVWRGGEYWLPKIPIESIDATGAGDAFAGALAFGIARQLPLIEAARLANAVAALATTKIGAQTGLPRMDDVQALLGKIAA